MVINDCSKTMNFTIFEENNRFLDMVRILKMRHQIKHIVIKNYHYRTHAKKRVITLKKINTTEEEVDFSIKLLVQQIFGYLRRKLMD